MKGVRDYSTCADRLLSRGMECFVVGAVEQDSDLLCALVPTCVV